MDHDVGQCLDNSGLDLRSVGDVTLGQVNACQLVAAQRRLESAA
jgi:hypothetical protein